MWGVKLSLVLLTCVYPDPVAESWSLFGTGNNTCALNDTCEEEGARGVFSRPGFLDRFADHIRTGEWGWFAQLVWRFAGHLFLQGIMWCGTLCDFVGIAASWSYWLMVGVVGVFLLQLGVWTVTWIILPLAQHSYALIQYLRGKAPWHEVASLHGLSTFRPNWVGPRAGAEWSAAYIQQEVRGRGESREPHDLLVTDGLAVARLRHGTLRGRTNRNGFKCSCSGVHSSSHRYFRNQLESMGCVVHLCAEDPCGAPEEEGWHVFASAIIPRTQAYDLQEAAGKGPWGRCLMATRFWGCRSCFCFSGLFKLVGWLARKFFGCCCRPSRRGLANTATVQRHEDSETESEAEVGETCQAERIAMLQEGHVVPLSQKPCKDVRKGGGIALLPSDLTYSSREELEKDGEVHSFHACNHHRALYENHANKKTCVIEGCGNESKVVKGGLRLCKLHATKEERFRKDSRSSRDAVFSQDQPTKSEPDGEVVTKGRKGEPEARFAPGSLPTSPEDGQEKTDNAAHLPYEELGQYLRLLMQGKTAAQALQEVVRPNQEAEECWSEMRKAASEYLPKLPEDYPSVARLGIINLLTEGVPAAPSSSLDPILDLDHPASVHTTLHPSVRRESYDPLRLQGEGGHGQFGIPRQTSRAEERTGPGVPLNTQALYRPKGGERPRGGQTPLAGLNFGGREKTSLQSLAPPRPQDAFAAVARPRHLGAYTEAEPHAVDDATKALQAIAKTLTNKDESANHERGKVSAIGKTEERLVFLVRGCDALTVSVGAATVGKELFYSLKATATQGRPQLRAIQFPVNIGNRVAFGLASMSIGNRDIKSMPDYCLSASDFPLTTEEDFDPFIWRNLRHEDGKAAKAS